MVTQVDGGVEAGDSRLGAQLVRLEDLAQHRHAAEREAEVGGDPRQRHEHEGDDDREPKPISR